MRKFFLIAAALLLTCGLATAQEVKSKPKDSLDVMWQRCRAIPNPPDGISQCGVMIIDLEFDLLTRDVEAAKKDLEVLKKGYPQFFED